MERNKASCRKLAVTVWNNRIAPVFDVAGRVLVTDVEDGGLANERLMDLQGQSASEKLGFLSALGVGHIICGAISREAFFLARMLGMDVMPFVAGEVETVLSGWLSGTLDAYSFAMPGCGDCGLRCRCRKCRRTHHI